MIRSFDKLHLGAFATLGIITIASVLLAFQLELTYLMLIPAAILVVYIGIINFRLLYYLLLFCIPISMEYNFSPSLGTDLPDEPLMIGLMLLTFLYLARNPKALPKGFFGNILIVALVIHLFWIFITALTSVNFLVSFKVFLSKIWYVTSFTVLTAIVIRTQEDLKRAFWCIYIPLTLAIAQVIARHALLGFAFEDINLTMFPFFRNHVNYAAIVSIFLPLIWLARSWYPKGSFKRKLLGFSILFYIVAIYLSYTRTCYLAVLMILPVSFMIRHKLTRLALVAVSIITLVFISFLFKQNRYLHYAPDFQETIYHEDFDAHLESTFEGKDVSSMERVYRWVAATKMIKEHPWFGFGPGNFYPYYKSYTVTSFQTYVSDNPEKSTAHDYFILVLSEQGFIGLAIFIFLTAVIFIYGEKIYHRIQEEEDKRIVLGVLMVFAMVYINLLLSDMMESDKVGPFFFIGLALLASYDIKHRSLQAKSE